MTTSNATTCEWTITGMDCGSCAGKVRGAVERLPGVSQVDVALMTERLRLSLDLDQTSRDHVETAVKKLGYGIAPKGSAPSGKGFVLPDGAIPAGLARDEPLVTEGMQRTPVHTDGATARDLSWYQTGKGRLVIGTGALLIAAWAVKLTASDGIANWAFILATLIGVAPIARRAINAARAGMPFTIEMLMTIAATGALVIDAAEEAALVVFLFAVGEVLEGVAANKARDGIRALAGLVPKTALLEVSGQTREVPAESLKIGQTVLVRPGDRVPADGEVIEGVSGVDESSVTGESVPNLKEPGHALFAGSINTEAVLRVRVTKAAEDNTIARIIRLVEEAESARAPTERFIDRFSRIYMPAVVGLALMVAIVPPLAFAQPWDTWVYRALALLLIGCPCALVISVPASIASALSAGARRGLLMKGGAVIEAAARTTHVAFDKTGTLTQGRPELTDFVTTGDEDAILAQIASIEALSEHPIAEAITRAASTRGLQIKPAQEFSSITGMGARGMVDGAEVLVGADRFMLSEGVDISEFKEQAGVLGHAGKTPLFAAIGGQLAALVGVSDPIKPTSKSVIAALHGMGLRVAMITGDNNATAQAIAAELGIDEVTSEVMPDGKVAALEALRPNGEVLTFVGDGINDAPALAAADIGVAVGTGTDVAIETADVVLMSGNLDGVGRAIDISRRTMRNIRQNLFWAFAYNAALIPVAAGVLYPVSGILLSPMLAAGAMALSSVFVLSNALRLRYIAISGSSEAPQQVASAVRVAPAE